MPNTTKYLESVQDIFSDQNLVNTLFANADIHRYISAQNFQFDLICKYLPKLLDALEIKRDNVLCSDNFAKDYINPQTIKSNKMDAEIFSANAKKLENEYNLNEFFDKTYMNCSKYGEDFLYVVPYHVAFERLVTRSKYRKNNARLGQISFFESTTYSSQVDCIHENYVESKEFKSLMESAENIKPISKDKSFDNTFKGYDINIHFNDTGVISESINERVVLSNKQEIEKFRSLSEIYESNITEESSLSKQYEKIKLDNDKLTQSSASDGLIIPGSLNIDPDKIDKDINGAVLERLPRENIVPVYIGKKCLGYYYLEFAENKDACGFCGSTHMTPGTTNQSNLSYRMSEDQQELAIRFIASKISASIDTHFINANKDLKEEIYSILQYNEKFDISRSNDIGVTFIPAEDIVHCYFEFDENSHRGVSDLQKSLIPAMLYILLYLTDIIGKITRSTDRRIYYVKQNVETNVARTMMNVVAQIKKGNFGMRQIESMNNILNVVGKYNDYIIPMGQSGDPPIQFEVMQGQDIQTPTDIMEKMEELAVNATGVPLEMVNSTLQQDFAVRFSMSNSRFLRSILIRQTKVQKFLSRIYTKIYNYEYDENYSLIELLLPPPIYLILNNNQQLLDNQSQYADKIVEIYLTEEEEEVKAEFKKLYMRSKLSTYIDYDSIERLIDTAKVNIESKKSPATEESTGDDSENSDYNF
jgi:hypothetical protein